MKTGTSYPRQAITKERKIATEYTIKRLLSSLGRNRNNKVAQTTPFINITMRFIDRLPFFCKSYFLYLTLFFYLFSEYGNVFLSNTDLLHLSSYFIHFFVVTIAICREDGLTDEFGNRNAWHFLVPFLLGRFREDRFVISCVYWALSKSFHIWVVTSVVTTFRVIILAKSVAKFVLTGSVCWRGRAFISLLIFFEGENRTYDLWDCESSR